MVTERRFASPQTNVTKQNKRGRTKRYYCLPNRQLLPTLLPATAEETTAEETTEE